MAAALLLNYVFQCLSNPTFRALINYIGFLFPQDCTYTSKQNIMSHKYMNIYLISLVSICSIGYCGTSYGAEISFDNCFSATSGPMSLLAICRILSPSICRLSVRNGAGLSDPKKKTIAICKGKLNSSSKTETINSYF